MPDNLYERSIRLRAKTKEIVARSRELRRQSRELSEVAQALIFPPPATISIFNKQAEKKNGKRRNLLKNKLPGKPLS
jgi:hypothetical protein